MPDPVLFLSRPAGEGLRPIKTAVLRKGREPVWILLLAAVFAAGAALACAAVVIFGAPGGDPGRAGGDPVRMAIQRP